MSLALGFGLLCPAQTRADAVVNDCTQDALIGALAGGDLVTFAQSCSITVSNTIAITNDVTLDGAGFAVTLAGSGQVQLLSVASGVQVTLANLTLSGGLGTNGGALYINPMANVVLSNCTFRANAVLGSNGVAGAAGSTNSTGDGGSGRAGTPGISGFGGAVFNLGGLTVVDCRFATNSSTGGNGGNGGIGGDGGGQFATGGNGGAGGAGGVAYGGAICNFGTLSVSNSTFSGNSVTGGIGGTGGAGGTADFAGLAGSGAAGGSASGAGLYSTQNVTLVNCTFVGNTATGGNSAGGGTDSNGEGAAGARGADAGGGGIFSLAAIALTNCTFYANTTSGGSGGNGGHGTGTLSNGGNGGNGGNGSGGGLYTKTGVGTNLVVNCTFVSGGASGGTNGIAGTGPFPGSNGSPGASRGGNLANGGGVLWLKNSIVATNVSGGNGYGTITDGGQNISSDTNITFGSQSKTNTNPSLGLLADNGGPTQTMAPLSPSSPAVDFADCTAAPMFDQRGLARPIGAACDSGAYELGWTVSGTVTSGTNGLAGVRISAGNWSTTTDASGNYVLGVFPGTYTVTAALAGYEFSPTPSQMVITTNLTADFSATTVFAISGQVTVGTNGLAGVSVSAGGQSATTDTNGAYQLSLRAGTYSLTPALDGYGFQPSAISVAVGPSTNGLDFTATRVFTLAGQIVSGTTTNGLAGVAVTAAGPTTTNVSSTTSSGSYLVTGLPQGTYLVTPSKGCLHFTSPSATVAVESNTSGINFSGTGDNYTLSGQISEQGKPLAAVTLTLGPRITVTDTNGNYVFANLCGGSYSLAPLLTCYQFNPGSVAVSLAPGSPTNYDFAAIHNVHSISGRITQGGIGLPGVGIQAGTQSTNTDANGYYTLAGLCPGTYSLTPVENCLLFNPSSRSVTVSQDVGGIDFIGYSNDVFSIRGQITLGATPLASVTVSVGGNSTVSDANGNYVLTHVCPGQYTVVPSSVGYGFSPASKPVSVTADVNGVNFSAYPGFSISGQISIGTNGLAGVAVTTAGLPAVTTDSNGFYTISNAPAGTNLVVPTLSCYAFNPSSLAVTVGPPSSTNGVNFAAAHDIHFISGRITEGAVGLAGVTVQIGNQFTNTDSQGYYTLAGLCPGVYPITPTLACYLFNPPSRTASLGPDSPGLDFVAFLNTFSVGGRVAEGTNALPGVTVALSGPLADRTVVTDSGGNYLFQSVCSGSYTIIPSPPAGYTFLPAIRSATLSSDANNLNFAALAAMSISNAGGGAFLISGLVSNGYVYRVEASTNLALNGPSIWQTISTNNVAPFQFLDTNTLGVPIRFYRMNR